MKRGNDKKKHLTPFLDGYTNFDCMRAPRGTTQRGSGGVTDFVKDVLVNNNVIRRIFTDMSECVILLIDTLRIFNDGIHDIVLIYSLRLKNFLFTPKNDDGIVI